MCVCWNDILKVLPSTCETDNTHKQMKKEKHVFPHFQSSPQSEFKLLCQIKRSYMIYAFFLFVQFRLVLSRRIEIDRSVFFLSTEVSKKNFLISSLLFPLQNTDRRSVSNASKAIHKFRKFIELKLCILFPFNSDLRLLVQYLNTLAPILSQCPFSALKFLITVYSFYHFYFVFRLIL